jgi:chromosome segregation ATPase
VKFLTSSSQNLFQLQTVSLIADALSIAGFALTIWVLLETRKLRLLYKLRARGPSLIRELQKIVSNLTYSLDNYSTSIAQIDQELGKVEIKLKSLEAKLIGAPKNSVKLVRSSIDQCEVNLENEERVRRVCREVVKVLEELKDHQKDLDWER